MDMGHMHTGSDMPDPFYLQRVYWAVVGSLVGTAALANVLNYLLKLQRLRDSTPTPSKPKSIFFSAYATVTALFREASYATPPPISICGRRVYFAPLGPLAIVMANLVVVINLCFYKLDTKSQWAWEDIGYRTGFITIAQLPLIYLLAGRRNIIGFLAGIGHHRLNWFHRWIARTVWLCATFHMGFWFRSWGRYNYIVFQLQHNGFAKRGFAAWCILTFIIVSSVRPIRQLGYEFFVLQHLVMFVGFTVAVWLHATAEAKAWVWIPVGLLVFDRVMRYAWATYINLSIFYRPSSHTLWANRATFTSLPGKVTRVTIENPGTGWTAGQHIFLTCNAIAPLQSHPFTIASIPEDNRIDILIRAEKGATRRFFQYASKHDHALGVEAIASSRKKQTVFLEGPYGTLRALRQFDSVVFLAGGMGATFTTPLLRDVIAQWKQESLQCVKFTYVTVTKRIHFIWVIRSGAHLSWFEAQLQSVLLEVNACRSANPNIVREVEMSIYVTCGERPEHFPQNTPSQPSTTHPASPEPEIVKSPSPGSSGDNKEAAGETKEKDAISIHSTQHASLPNPITSGCCCTTVTKDVLQSHPKCPSCGSGSRSQPLVQYEPRILTPPSLTLFSGRPAIRTLIRQALEKAEGESAVVACGPPELSDDVRRSVVYLSDERAVHKGTGAQGVYLHIESFGN
ncbi:FAD-binding domain-containing protein [Aspergillus californicus]